MKDSLEFSIRTEMHKKIYREDLRIVSDVLSWEKNVRKRVLNLTDSQDLVDTFLIVNNDINSLNKIYVLGVDGSFSLGTLAGFHEFIDSCFGYKKLGEGFYYNMVNEEQEEFFQAKGPTDTNQLSYFMYMRKFALNYNEENNIFVPLRYIALSKSDFLDVKRGIKVIESLNGHIYNPDFSLINYDEYKRAI